MTDRLRTIRERVRRWYDTLPNPVKAATVAAWVVFVAQMTAPTLRLADDLVVWVEGTGPFPDVVTWGRLARAAGTAALGAAVNYLYRLRFPGPIYLPRRELPPPDPAGRNPLHPDPKD